MVSQNSFWTTGIAYDEEAYLSEAAQSSTLVPSEHDELTEDESFYCDDFSADLPLQEMADTDFQ